MSQDNLLFACSRCYSRHPFEELSSGQQLCKSCRNSYPIVKCTYCRTEFQQTSKSSVKPLCKKCDMNEKSYGKPTSCQYCNVIAAFIGSKCQRCTNSERKYGLPVTCEQCKMQCAFDRKDEEKKIEGKLLCWLCTLSYKRALAKTRQTDPTRHSHVKLGSSRDSQQQQHKKKPYDKRPLRPDVTKQEGSLSPVSKKPLLLDKDSSEKKGGGSGGIEKTEMEANNCSDHVVMLTQLREQIANLNKQLQQKDQQLLAKERQITELRASNFTTESELRNKLKEAQRDFDTKTNQLASKIKQLQKDLASKNKSTSTKKASLTIVSRNNNNNNESSDIADDTSE